MSTKNDIVTFREKTITKDEIIELVKWLDLMKMTYKQLDVLNVIEKLLDFFDLKMQDEKFLRITENALVKKDLLKEIRKFDEDNEFYIIIDYDGGHDSITFKTKDEMEKAFLELQTLLK